MSPRHDNAGRGRKSPAARREALRYLLDAAQVLHYSEADATSEISRWAEYVARLTALHLRALDRGVNDVEVDRWIEATRLAFDRHAVKKGGQP